MTIKILAIGDSGDNLLLMKKYMKNMKMDIITFPRAGGDLLTTSNEEIKFFDSLRISKQVKKINQIKKNYDICIVMTWSAARVAYLSNLNYIMYFTGGDITTPPFIKKPTLPYLKEPASDFNWIERNFYKKVFNSAVAVIAPMEEYFFPLKKYRKDAIRIDRLFVDIEKFNDRIEPMNIEKNKFIFLSAQRFGLEKGFDIIFDAINKCKTDFEVWQIEWFIEGTNEERMINKELLKNIPKQFKFIPLVKREDLGKLFRSVDAVLGQMRSGIQGGIERDAAYCKCPVICYTNSKMILDGIEILPPFLPNSRNPEQLAELLDKIVSSKKFREDLAEKEYEYILNLSNPEKVSKEFEEIFIKVIKKYQNINHKSSKLRKIFENFLFNQIEKFVYIPKMKEKNIRVWGKQNYYDLMK